MTPATMARTVFLDRDGILIEDHGLPVDVDSAPIPSDVPAGLDALARHGFRLVVISNQAVVARGWETEEQVIEGERAIERRLRALGAPPLDGFYFCPHHPNATLQAYRRDCDCRKPRPGLLLRAAEELGLDLAASYFIGDRATDVAAGQAGHCRTILLRAGSPLPAIETTDDLPEVEPDLACATFAEAVTWILGRSA